MKKILPLLFLIFLLLNYVSSKEEFIEEEEKSISIPKELSFYKESDFTGMKGECVIEKDKLVSLFVESIEKKDKFYINIFKIYGIEKGVSIRYEGGRSSTDEEESITDEEGKVLFLWGEEKIADRIEIDKISFRELYHTGRFDITTSNNQIGLWYVLFLGKSLYYFPTDEIIVYPSYKDSLAEIEYTTILGEEDRYFHNSNANLFYMINQRTGLLVESDTQRGYFVFPNHTFLGLFGGDSITFFSKKGVTKIKVVPQEPLRVDISITPPLSEKKNSYKKINTPKKAKPYSEEYMEDYILPLYEIPKQEFFDINVNMEEDFFYFSGTGIGAEFEINDCFNIKVAKGADVFIYTLEPGKFKILSNATVFLQKEKTKYRFYIENLTQISKKEKSFYAIVQCVYKDPSSWNFLEEYKNSLTRLLSRLRRKYLNNTVVPEIEDVQELNKLYQYNNKIGPMESVFVLIPSHQNKMIRVIKDEKEKNILLEKLFKIIDERFAY